jgi:hypothetical protein
MSRKIKTSILKSNNLRSINSNSRVSSKDPANVLKSITSSMDELQFVRLKSLSEQRNIAKTLKRIDSPKQGKFKLFDTFGSVKP